MFLAKSVQRKGKRVYRYWVLKETLWDAKERRISQRYLISLGPKRTITETQAREIAEKLSQKLGRPVTLEDLRKVKRLRIVPDSDADGQGGHP